MDFDDGAEKEEDEVGIKISHGLSFSGASTLASMESLSLPIVQEVVVFADLQCKNCQKRVSDIITKMNDFAANNFLSVTLKLVEATLRVSARTETESLEVNVLEKKVTLTFSLRLPTVAQVMQQSQLAPPITRTSLPKAAIIKRLFRSIHVLH